ncbi:hypothetical protein ACHAQA_005574 [Verticillium albo-atrum]
MVKIAIAGGSGNLGQEVIDGLVATGKHEILLLSRKDVPSDASAPGVTWIKADYQDTKQLTEVLRGVDTVLSFIVAHLDEGSVGQKNLIDASVAAGVRRFAPSEWFSSSFEHMAWYNNKLIVRDYLKELNKDKKVLEYTLFQPGFFLNYFTYPHRSAKHIQPVEFPVSFEKRRALIQEGSENAPITLTSIDDIVYVVTSAIDYEGVWPVVGGIRGSEVTLGQLIALGEKVRGPFNVERLQVEDLKAGVNTSDWRIKTEHPAIDPAQAEAFGTMFVTSLLQALPAGSLRVTDEWNQLLPGHEFTQPEEFLTEFWKGRP